CVLKSSFLLLTQKKRSKRKGSLAGAAADSWLERFSLPATPHALDAAVLRRVQRGRPSGTASKFVARTDFIFTETTE
ncbi:MAG: hypothetical protein IJG80_11210, partial [Selenomonadaceae bacterium]|nr:hypothetical protein [Selenomonadaceae bacterium]